MKIVLRISEAANQLGVSVKTIRRWDRIGLIECFRTAGGHRRFSSVEIQRIRISDSDFSRFYILFMSCQWATGYPISECIGNFTCSWHGCYLPNFKNGHFGSIETASPVKERMIKFYLVFRESTNID